MKYRYLARCAVCFAVLALIVGIWRIRQHNRSSRRWMESNPPVALSAEDLAHTVVSPYLPVELAANKNVIWCATMQLAWDALCQRAGERIHLTGDPEMVSILNAAAPACEDLDPSCFVAVAGAFNARTIQEIEGELSEKFGETESPQFPFIGLEPTGTGWLAYSYLAKTLPFESAFKCLEEPLDFAGMQVKAFGISQYLKAQKDEAKAAQQVIIHDYLDNDDFVIELKTTSDLDRLILAKVVPSATLAETVNMVADRISRDGATIDLMQGSDLSIPILDFHVVREYSELCGRTIVSRNATVNGSTISLATQDIRFRLDERGALIKSRALMAAPVGQTLVFDKPFLLMIAAAGSDQPYLAIWIANPELLIPFDE